MPGGHPRIMKMIYIILSQVISMAEGRFQIGAVEPVHNMTRMPQGTPNCCPVKNWEHAN
jgi:hypothetical protein